MLLLQVKCCSAYYPEAIKAVLGIVNEEFQALLEKVHHGGTDNPDDVLAGDWSQK
jgi:hypothetical protein